MALYPYVATLAVDPVTLVKAAGATGVIYAPEDIAFASPLTATDASGNPIALTANTDGILPSFYATSPAVNWRSGSYVFPLVTSQPLEGPKGEPGTPGNNGSDGINGAKGADGLPGVNAVPTAEAVATYAATPGNPVNAAIARGEAPPWCTRPGRFNPRNSFYNEQNAPLLHASLARALNGGANALWAVLRDSTGWGAGATTPYTENAWPSQVRKDFVNNFGDFGGYSWSIFQDQLNTAADSTITHTGLTRPGTYGMYQESRRSTVVGTTLTHVGANARKAYVDYIEQPGGGTFTIDLTGAAQVTVDTNGAAIVAKRISVVGSTSLSATRTLVLTHISGAFVDYLGTKLIGFDNGFVEVARLARNGAQIGNISGTEGLRHLSLINPDVSIISFTINAWQQQAPIETFKTQHRAVIENRLNAGKFIMLDIGYPSNDTALTPGPIPQSSYWRAYYELADEYNLTLHDFAHQWESWARSNAEPFAYFADNLHASPRGHFETRQTWTNFLLGSWRKLDAVQLAAANLWGAPQTISYPGASGERLVIGGTDDPKLLEQIGGNLTGATIPYIAPTAAGGVFESAKAGQDITTFSRRVQSGNPFRNWRKVDGKSSNYTVTATDDVIEFTGVAGQTITLPDPSSAAASRREYVIANSSANSVNVVSAGTAKTIGGVATVTLASNESLSVLSNSLQWLRSAAKG